MPTYINPSAVRDHSITSVKLADNVIPTDASIAAMGYTKNQGTITEITMNGTSKGTSGVVNLGTVITDVSNLATKSAAIGSLSLNLDSTNYKITLSGTKVDGSAFTVQNVIDLPLESVVVDGSYNNTTKKVVLTLQNGSSIDFSVADLVAGLQSEITLSNKLSADLIQDGNTNKTVTATEKSTWNSYANVQSDWNQDTSTNSDYIKNKPFIKAGTGAYSVIESNFQWNTARGAYSHTEGFYTRTNNEAEHAEGAYNVSHTGDASTEQSLSTIGIGVQDSNDRKRKNAVEVMKNGDMYVYGVGNYDGSNYINASTLQEVVNNSGGGASGTLNTTATTAQSTNASESLSGSVTLHKVAKTGTYNDLIGKPTIPTVNNATLTIQKNGTNVQTFTANASSNVTANITVNELPAVTSSDNGKVLMVVNGVWSMVTPVSIYSGSGAPDNTQGINGDIYLQV